MTIYVKWLVKSGGLESAPVDPVTEVTAGVPDAAVDWTNRTESIEVSMSCDVGRIGEASASVTLDNSDGAFTPFGGGTYEDWDWLSKPVWIQAQTGTNPASLTTQNVLFAGLVTDVQYEDDGFSSTVTIGCTDPFSIAGRSVLDSDWDNFLAPEKSLEAIQSLNTYIPALSGFGADTASQSLIGLPAGITVEPYKDVEFSADTGTVFGDLVADIVVAEHGIYFPFVLYFYGSATTTQLRYKGAGIARDWLWAGKAGYPPIGFDFVETTPTGSELPFRSPTVGFSIDNLTNSASCTIAGAGAVTQTADNTTSQTAYGVRSADFTNLLFGYDADALELAEHLVARYDRVQYGVTGLTITGGMIQSKCADAALTTVEELVVAPHFDEVWNEVHGCLFKPVFVEFTGAGGVDLSSRITFFKASYRITPEDWELTLSDGRPAVSSFGFVIGETNYGVLGTNKVA